MWSGTALSASSALMVRQLSPFSLSAAAPAGTMQATAKSLEGRGSWFTGGCALSFCSRGGGERKTTKINSWGMGHKEWCVRGFLIMYSVVLTA